MMPSFGTALRKGPGSGVPGKKGCAAFFSALAGRETLRREAAGGMTGFNRKVERFTGGELEGASLAVAGPAATGVYQLLIGGIAVAARYVPL